MHSYEPGTDQLESFALQKRCVIAFRILQREYTYTPITGNDRNFMPNPGVVRLLKGAAKPGSGAWIRFARDILLEWPTKKRIITAATGLSKRVKSAVSDGRGGNGGHNKDEALLVAAARSNITRILVRSGSLNDCHRLRRMLSRFGGLKARKTACRCGERFNGHSASICEQPVA
jgi:hypothetical protein